MPFQALILDSTGGELLSEIRSLTEADLPPGDVLLSIDYSSLNYKDGLAVTGNGKIVRAPFPFVPGIDLAGTVISSDDDRWRTGDRVIGTGWGLGENTWGGYSQRQRVNGDWLVRLPEELAPRDAMAIGTAGFTAMLSVMALEAHGISPDRGEIVVTGASGGVGSMAVALLAGLGYTVVASSGKERAHDFLIGLGASRTIAREVLGNGPRRDLDSARWAGGVDSVGGQTLAAVLSQTGRHGAVAACGLAGGAALSTTVFPFILRGVNLLGIDSNTCPVPLREAAWKRLATEISMDTLAELMHVVPLGNIPRYSREIIAGRVMGRIVVDVNA